MVILFAASKVLSHTVPCFESHGIPGGIENRYSITYILQIRKLKRHLPQCQEHSRCSINPFIHSFHVLPVLSDHLMHEHSWLRGIKWLTQCDTANKGQRRHLNLSCLALHFTLQAAPETERFQPLHEFMHCTSSGLNSPLQERGTSNTSQSCRKFLK